jgi:DUF4097 and DUF4098 domain-containing protein YvlB
MFGNGAEYREEFSLTKPATGHSEFSLNNINGTVDVVGVDGAGDVEITGVKIVRDNSVDEAKSHIGDIAIDVEESSSAVSVTTKQPEGGSGRSYSVNYRIRVPSAWKVLVENTNGAVQIRAIRNNVQASVTNGDLHASDVAGNVSANVTNGQIRADLSLPENGSCRLETVNGAIKGKLNVATHVSCNAETVNGEINLAIPQSASATVSAQSMVGSVKTSNLPLQKSNSSRVNMIGEKMSGTLGDGQGEIRLAVQNGSVVLSGF